MKKKVKKSVAIRLVQWLGWAFKNKERMKEVEKQNEEAHLNYLLTKRGHDAAQARHAIHKKYLSSL